MDRVTVEATGAAKIYVAYFRDNVFQTNYQVGDIVCILFSIVNVSNAFDKLLQSRREISTCTKTSFILFLISKYSYTTHVEHFKMFSFSFDPEHNIYNGPNKSVPSCDIIQRFILFVQKFTFLAFRPLTLDWAVPYDDVTEVEVSALPPYVAGSWTQVTIASIQLQGCCRDVIPWPRKRDTKRVVDNTRCSTAKWLSGRTENLFSFDE